MALKVRRAAAVGVGTVSCSVLILRSNRRAHVHHDTCRDNLVSLTSRFRVVPCWTRALLVDTMSKGKFVEGRDDSSHHIPSHWSVAHWRLTLMVQAVSHLFPPFAPSGVWCVVRLSPVCRSRVA